ncbi:hypothetical protein DFH27DRAFT_550901 [Peziza echinospora]|nr:hypothetical protein DFH27DRAFT_550901 [Peziza echinospora]
MGLAGPKKSTKISADPRNTNWSNDTDRFGHKILESYGWTPGSLLGNTASSHHAHLTSASSTGIKVQLKDDNLGIGAKRGSKDDECTGLDVFQDLLGRLNGKSQDDVEKAAAARMETKKYSIISERYRMKFVLGEVYHSSDIDKLIAKKKEDDEKVKLEEVIVKLEIKEEDESVASSSTGSSKKRKIKVEQGEEGREEKSSEKRKKRKAEKEQEKKEKKERKEKRSKRRKIKEEEVSSDEDEKSATIKEEDSEKTEKSRESSKERKERKERRIREKKEKKEKKRRRKESKESSSESESEDEPVAPVARVLSGRQAIRHRYIAAKRSAVMDSTSLNEIFMVKA